MAYTRMTAAEAAALIKNGEHIFFLPLHPIKTIIIKLKTTKLWVPLSQFYTLQSNEISKDKSIAFPKIQKAREMGLTK